MIMTRLRILVLGPDSNPERVSIPFVTYSHAAALAQLHDVTLAVRLPNEDALRRAKAPFGTIEVIRMPLLERIYAWSFRRIFRSNFASQAVTAFGYPFALAFEWRAWRQLRHRIFAGEFDVVLRIVPMTAVLPSPFAFFLRKGPIPFVIGPINGGLPFVKGFSQADSQKEWISSLRGLYRFLPFARSTYRHAAAIIAASSQTYAEFAVYRDKLFFVPEPGIDRSQCSDDSRSPEPGAKLELIFVGGLIPCKACDLALRAAAPLLRSDLARFTVVGDGPEGLAMSPKGNLAVAAILRGSNMKKAFFYQKNGSLSILKIDGKKVTKTQDIEVGGLPEAVMFTPDGKYILAGNYMTQDFSILKVDGTKVTDTGKRFKVPGHPASARMSH